MTTRAIFAVVAIITLFASSCASRGVPTRKVVGDKRGELQPDPPPGYDPAASWYIEAPPVAGGKAYSCSFVEFDDRGDYLDFRQHRHAYEKIRSLSQRGERVAVVMFLHGWRNSSQSGNVTGFVAFLKQLAEAEHIRNQGLRVHGVYLGWRGGVFKPSPVGENDIKATGFSRSIIDPGSSSPVPGLTNTLETFAYHNDKSLPEYMISGTAVSRTIYTCAHTAKRHGAKERNRVFLMGHSFGALLLERTFMNATLGELTKEWAWGETSSNTNANPLPFDTVLLVNSAAPSIYAKQFQGYLAAHRQAMVRAGVPGADAPIFISLTSEADGATGKIHRLGNLFAGGSPTLKHDYYGYEDFILKKNPRKPEPRVPQAEYYRMTPGHNPLLVNRWVEPCPDPHHPVAPGLCLQENLKLDVSKERALHFFTTNDDRKSVSQWMIRRAPELSLENEKWSTWGDGYQPVCWDTGTGPTREDRGQSAYWIMRCPGEIINGHNDIWNQKAMETYAALFRVATVMKKHR